ncbi:glycosyltransferase [Methanosarcina mazei Tuc01]|uniref:Glycosyltransferase n=1 Tax=Methanosarcina mazei Tuc01 TaxID=1236903 RepID=M1Q462_METMZ|nr:bifunctional polysaccharide deacetylase/glycosyltransferase family 2 protein [Methanosarcina mazei]AGF97085.1 glycosyltransferase [Methanosarcina mazei Tuc01]
MVKERIGDFVKFQKTEVINRPETIFGRKEKSDKKFSDSSGNSVNKLIPVASLILAVLITLSIGLFLYEGINHLNNGTPGSVTILEEPELLDALRNAQDRGVLLAMHGWAHEDYSTLTPLQIKENIEKGKYVFEKAGIVPVAFILPEEPIHGTIDASLKREIESNGIPTELPVLETDGTYRNEYTWNWREMESLEDSRYQEASEQIREDNPTTILLHAQDWNPYTKQFITDYLSSTNERNVTIRVDDVEVNTRPEMVSDMAQLTQYESVGQVAFAVIPAGAGKGDNPAIGNININRIMGVYFWFFIITSLLPLSFFATWKLLSKWHKNRKQNRYLLEDGRDPKDPNTKGPILVSVISPAYNEEKSIGKCLQSILNQDYKGKMEVIAVNDGSSDRTAEIISKYPVKLLDLKVNGGKANALNKAIEIAKGDILIFTDSDSYMAPNAVSSLVKCLNENEEAQMVAGNVFIHDNRGKKGIMKYFQMIEYRTEQEIIRHLQGLSGSILVCPGPLTAVRRKVCDVISFSNETIVEDADFTIKALKNSIKIIQEPEAIVYTDAPETVKGWYKQRKRWWYGNLQLWRLHKKWAMKNPWMIFNYSGYITGICSIILIMSIPYLILQYDNIPMILMSGILCLAFSIMLYIIYIGPLFATDKRLLLMLILYVLIYATIKVVVISSLFLCYLTGKGVKVKFGAKSFVVR